MMYVAMALEERKILKVFIKHNAFTPDRAIDFEHFINELAELLGCRPWKPYAEFRVLGIRGVKKIDDKIYLNVREYLLRWHLLMGLMAWATAMSIFLIPPWLLHPMGIELSVVVTFAIILTLIAIPLILLACQPLLSHIIASKIGRLIRRRG